MVSLTHSTSGEIERHSSSTPNITCRDVCEVIQQLGGAEIDAATTRDCRSSKEVIKSLEQTRRDAYFRLLLLVARIINAREYEDA